MNRIPKTRVLVVSFGLLVVFIFLLHMNAFAQVSQQTWERFTKQDSENQRGKLERGLRKSGAYRDRKYYFMNGNQISGNIYNYGGIAPGPGLIRHVNNMVWHGMGDIYEFSPLVLASVIDTSGNRRHICDNSLRDNGDISPDGTVIWGWEPLPDYADPNSGVMASSGAPDLNGDGKPDSWPTAWYNPTLGRYVWPGYLSQDATNADLEVLWGMDDKDNAKYPYYPFPNDSSRRGLGVFIEGRVLQWSNPLAEDCIFFVYSIQNTSSKALDSVVFGMYGDIDVGGGYPQDPTEESQDDLGYFITPFDSIAYPDPNVRSMVYCWDYNGIGHLGMKTHYDACKFLESPGNPYDGVDNDGDGMVDESQWNGIDDNHNWNPLTDDVGVDGIPDTGDEGEGDGVPTAGKRLPSGLKDPLHPGEPNFELTDLAESDMIGLTSFSSWTWATDWVRNTENMWRRTQLGSFAEITQIADITILYGSGFISLRPNGVEVTRFSIALLMGADLNDLLINALTVQKIYNANYRFYKPPEKPTVTAVPGDRKVTLYWDTKAESSVDPLLGQDFEGYVIYRSTDPQFQDITTITDGQGTGFLCVPLKDTYGKDCRWDVKDKWQGYHPLSYGGRGIHYYVGDNRGLVHTYVDSNGVVNGQTYYCAVVAYDHGDSIGVPPSETTKRISVDPVTNQYQFDRNTVAVIPGPRASGYEAPVLSDDGIDHVKGISTAAVSVPIINDLAVKSGKEYMVFFSDTLHLAKKDTVTKNYSVLCTVPVTETFVTVDTNFVRLDKENISKDSVLVIKDQSGKVYIENVDYVISYDRGLIRRTAKSSMANNASFVITYRYHPIYQSTFLQSEDDNPVFDGMKLFLRDEKSQLDPDKTKWITRRNSNVVAVASDAKSGTAKPFRGDFEVRFNSTQFDTVTKQFLSPGDTAINRIVAPFTVWNIRDNLKAKFFISELAKSRNSRWDIGETVVLMDPDRAGTSYTSYQVTFNPKIDTIVTRVDTTIDGKDTTILRSTYIDKTVMPESGDVFQIFSKKTFFRDDVYKFKTQAARANNQLASSRMDKIYIVPNPYVAANAIEPSQLLPGQVRGERRLYFENLPQKATIRIYTITGELVQTLYHDTQLETGREFWNLLNRDGLGVAYGVYIAHIDAPEVGEKILKFAIIK
jgi:hypothetical protein